MDEKTLLGALAESLGLWDGRGDCPLALTQDAASPGTWRIGINRGSASAALVQVEKCSTRRAALAALEAWLKQGVAIASPETARPGYTVALYKDGAIVTCPVCREYVVVGAVGGLWFRCGGKSCGAEYDMRKEDR